MGTVSEDPISLWLKLGALDKLEQALMDGYGEQLIGKASRIPQVSRFLKQVPTLQAQIEEMHEAIMQGNLEQVKELLSQQRKLTFCRDQQGASPLHKAVLFQQRDVVTFFVEHFPSIMHARDHQGRTPLHYAAVLQDDGEMYNMLRAAGSDDNATDVYGHTPDSYLESPGELTVEQLKEGATVTRVRRKGHRRRKSGDDAASNRGYSAKPAGLKVQIREVIAQGNLEALEELVLHGHGDKLLGETSPNPLVQEFLDTVPGYMEQINDVHRAVVRGRLREVQTLMNHKSLALARDSLGATPIHKAVMHGHMDIAEHLAENFPECLRAKDVDGRTPLHYAALLKDNRKMYNMLIAAGAPPAIVDYKGKSAEYFLQYPEKLNLSQIIKRNQLANATYMGNTITRLKTMAPGFSKTLVHLHEKYNYFNDQIEHSHTNGMTNGDDEVQSNSSSERADKNAPSANPVEPMKKVMMRSRPLLPAVILPRLEVTSANIRKWIEDQDLKKLQGAVLEGYGERLTKEAPCDDGSVDQYLRQDVPRILERIQTIHRAVTDDDVPELETQLECSDYALARDHLGMTPLHKAVILGRQDAVKLLVEKFPETINARDREGRTALHYAAASARKNGRRQIYKILVQNGSDTRIRDNHGRSSEYYKTHHLQIPPEVAQHESHVRARSKNRLEAPRSRSRQNSLTSSQLLEKVTAALQKGNLSQIRELVLEGYGKHLLGRTSWNEEVRQYLKSLPQFLQTASSVHEAAAAGDLKKLKELTEANETLIKVRNEQGNQPIHTAVESKDMDSTKFILEKFPASISAKAAHGRYPIHLAALLKDNDMYKFLVDRGANPRALDQKGRTAEYYMKSGKGDTKSAALSDAGLTTLADPKLKTEQPVGTAETSAQRESKEPQSKAVDPDKEKQIAKEDKDEVIESKAEQEVKTLEGDIGEGNLEKTESETKTEETENSSGAGESDSVDAEDRLNELIDLWIKEGDLLRLEHVVIAGQGERLRNKTSEDKHVQEFLSLVPTYMEKIKAVHDTVVRGNLSDVKQVLTRKRFALSRDQLGASPLHLAVLHGHTDILKFIIERYPETLDGPDNEGRTPLHYAAVVAESQNYFDTLRAAGADDAIKDKLGHTPEYYLKNPNELTIRDLLENYKLMNEEDNKSSTVDVWQRPPTPEEDTTGSAESQETQDESETPASEPEAKQKPKAVAKVEPVTEPVISRTQSAEPDGGLRKVTPPASSPTEDVKQLVQNMVEKNRSLEEKQFLMTSVGDTLIEGLIAVVKKRPDDPAEYLASWLSERAATEKDKPATAATDPQKTTSEIPWKQDEDKGSEKTESNSSSTTR